MILPTIHQEALTNYLRQVIEWIETEALTVPELTIKTWPNIGTIQINFSVKEPAKQGAPQ